MHDTDTLVVATGTHYAVSQSTPDGIVWYDWCYSVWSRYPVWMYTQERERVDFVLHFTPSAALVTVEQ